MSTVQLLHEPNCPFMLQMPKRAILIQEPCPALGPSLTPQQYRTGTCSCRRCHWCRRWGSTPWCRGRCNHCQASGNQYSRPESHRAAFESLLPFAAALCNGVWCRRHSSLYPELQEERGFRPQCGGFWGAQMKSCLWVQHQYLF